MNVRLALWHPEQGQYLYLQDPIITKQYGMEIGFGPNAQDALRIEDAKTGHALGESLTADTGESYILQPWYSEITHPVKAVGVAMCSASDTSVLH